MNKSNFYFTFTGNYQMAFPSGYLVIQAESFSAARKKFTDEYGKGKNGRPLFSFQYSEKEWEDIKRDQRRRYIRLYKNKDPKAFENYFELMFGPCRAFLTTEES